MPLNTILVPVNGTDADRSALAAAFGIGRNFDAHVDALFVKLDPRDAVPMLGEGMSGAMVEEIMRAAEAEVGHGLVLARGNFEEALRASGCELGDVRPAAPRPTARWMEAMGRIEDVVPVEGRLADLVVFARPQGRDDGQALTTIETTLLGSGRPILLVSEEMPEEIGRSVAVAWNGNAEAARAVAGAMPFLLSADSVRVLTAETSVTEAAAGRRIAEYLAWHGINAEITIVHPGAEAVGKALMDQAAALECDLLVMGGYGHSRMREMILGGVTRYVLNHAGLPVLMAH